MQYEKAAVGGLLSNSPFRGSIKCQENGVQREPLVRSIRKSRWGVETPAAGLLCGLRQCSILGIEVWPLTQVGKSRDLGCVPSFATDLQCDKPL